MSQARENSPPRPGDGRAAPRVRAAMRLALEGSLRWLSHHNEMRMIERAAARAGWPLGYSQGFNPRPGLTLPLPRSTGMASRSDWALIDLTEAWPVERLAESLRAALPEGAELLSIACPVSRRTPHAVRVEYEIELDPTETNGLADRLAAWLAEPSCVVQRVRDGEPPLPMDIRPFVETLVLSGQVLRIELRIDRQQSARPVELFTALGLDARRCGARVRRTEVKWDMDPARPPERPADSERNHLGQEESEIGDPHPAEARRIDESD